MSVIKTISPGKVGKRKQYDHFQCCYTVCTVTLLPQEAYCEVVAAAQWLPGKVVNLPVLAGRTVVAQTHLPRVVQRTPLQADQN